MWEGEVVQKPEAKLDDVHNNQLSQLEECNNNNGKVSLVVRLVVTQCCDRVRRQILEIECLLEICS